MSPVERFSLPLELRRKPSRSNERHGLLVFAPESGKENVPKPEKGQEDPRLLPLSDADWPKVRALIERVIAERNKHLDEMNADLQKWNPNATKEEKISLEELQQEWQGKSPFGPKSREAWLACARYLQYRELAYLFKLDDAALPVPYGCSMEPPLDKSGRHIDSDLFFEYVLSGKFRPRLLKHGLADGKLPVRADYDALDNCLHWCNLVEAELNLAKLAWNESEVKRLIDRVNDNGKLNGWYPDAKLPLKEREMRTAAAAEWAGELQEANDLVRTAALLHRITNEDDKSMLQKRLQKLTPKGWFDNISEDQKKLNLQEYLKGFPGEVKLDGCRVLGVDFGNLPQTPVRNRENLRLMEPVWNWNRSDKAEQIRQARAALLGGLEDEGRLLTVGEEPCVGLKPEDKDKYPKGHAKEGQTIPDYNHKVYGVDVQLVGERYVIKPYICYYWEGDLVYHGVGQRRLVDKVYQHELRLKPDQIVGIKEDGAIRVLPARLAGQWVEGRETAEKWETRLEIAGDVVLVVCGLGEVGWGVKGARVAARVTGRRGLAYAGARTLHGVAQLGFVGVNFGKRAIYNHFGKDGEHFVDTTHWLMLADMFVVAGPTGAMKTTAGRTIFGAEAFDKTNRLVSLMTRVGARHRTLKTKLLISGFDKVERAVFLGMDFDAFYGAYENRRAHTFDLRRKRSGQLTDQALKAAEDLEKDAQQDAAHLANRRDSPQPKQEVKVTIDRVLREYGYNLRAAERADEALQKRTEEVLKLPENSEERSKHKQKLIDVFVHSNNYSERVAAARGLVGLCEKDGKLPDVLGESEVIPGANPRLTLKLTSNELREFLLTTAPGLLEESGEVTLLKPDDPRRVAHLRRLVGAFQSSEPDVKLAAAVGLLSFGQDHVLGERLGESGDYYVQIKIGDSPETSRSAPRFEKKIHFSSKADADAAAKQLQDMYKDDRRVLVYSSDTGRMNVTAQDALAFVKQQSGAEASPYLQLVANDFRLRLGRTLLPDYEDLSRQLLEAKQLWERDRDNKELRDNFEKLEKRMDAVTPFMVATRYDIHDFTAFLLDLLAKPGCPTDVQFQVLLSRTGPRLDFIYEFLKYGLEPMLERSEGGDEERAQGADRRRYVLGHLYGRDSKAIEKVLDEIARNPNVDRNVRAAAALILHAESTTRLSVNGIPVNYNSQVEVGADRKWFQTQSYVRVTPKDGEHGIEGKHLNLKIEPDGRIFVQCIGDSEAYVIPGKHRWFHNETPYRVPNANPRWFETPSRWIEVNPENGDRVVLGPPTNKTELVFGAERVDLARYAHTLLDEKDYAGAYVKGLKGLLGDPAQKLDAFSPQSKEARMNKYLAAIALDRLGSPLADLGDKDQTARRINQALLECLMKGPGFDPMVAELALIKLCERISGNAPEKLTTDELAFLRKRALEMLKYPPIPDDQASDGGSTARFKVALAGQFDKLFKDAPRKDQDAAVQLLCQTLYRDPNSKVPNTLYRPDLSELRIAAIKPLAKLDPAAAKITLEKVVRFDPDPAVRGAAFKELKDLKGPSIRPLALELLVTENDPRLLSELRTAEYLARRPDRNSEEYQRRFRKACQDLQDSQRLDLSGSKDRIKKALEQNGAGTDALSNWLYRGRIDQCSQELADDLTYIVDTNAIDFVSGDQAQVVRNAVRGLKMMCQRDDAGDYSPHIKMLLLRNSAMKPDARLELLEALGWLITKNKCKLSVDEGTALVAMVLQNDITQTPRRPNHPDAEDHKRLQLVCLYLLSSNFNPAVTHLIEALADTPDYPFPEVPRGAQECYAANCEGTANLRQRFGADPKLSEKQLADQLVKVMANPKADAESLVIAIFSTFNRRPITDEKDVRRRLARELAEDPHPRVRLAVAHALFESTVPEDRRLAIELFAKLSICEKNGYGTEASLFIAGVREGKLTLQAGEKELLERTIERIRQEELARVLAVLPSDPFTKALLLTERGDGHSVKVQPRPDFERTIEYQERYEEALLKIAENERHGADPFADSRYLKNWLTKEGSDYKLFHDYNYQLDLVAETNKRVDYAKKITGTTTTMEGFPDRTELMGKAVWLHDVVRHGPKKTKEMNDDYIDAVKYLAERDVRAKLMGKRFPEANEAPGGSFNQLLDRVENGTASGSEVDMFKHIIRTHGDPFRPEFRHEVFSKCVKLVHKMCVGQHERRGQFKAFLEDVLVNNVNMDPDLRMLLLEAYLAMVKDDVAKEKADAAKMGSIPQHRAAIVLARMLDNEMKSNSTSNWQIRCKIIETLGEWGDRRVSPVLEAIVKHASSFLDRDAAEKVLNQFAKQDVQDLLDGRLVLGNMRFRADDHRVKFLITAIEGKALFNDKPLSEENRMFAAELLFTEGNGPFSASDRFLAERALEDFAKTSKNPEIGLKAAKIMYTLSDPARPRATALIADCAFSQDKNVASQAKDFLRTLKGKDLDYALVAISQSVTKEGAADRRLAAALLVLELTSEDTGPAPKRKALAELVDLRINGNGLPRQKAEQALSSLSPEDSRLAMYEAYDAFHSLLRDTSPTNPPDKQKITDCLESAVDLFVRSDGETKSPAFLFALYAKSEQFLGRDHETTRRIRTLIAEQSLGSQCEGESQWDVSFKREFAVRIIGDLALSAPDKDVRDKAQEYYLSLVNKSDPHAVFTIAFIAADGNEANRRAAMSFLQSIDPAMAAYSLEVVYTRLSSAKEANSEKLINCLACLDQIYKKAGFDEDSEERLMVRRSQLELGLPAKPGEKQAVDWALQDLHALKNMAPLVMFSPEAKHRYVALIAECLQKPDGKTSIEMAQLRLALGKVRISSALFTSGERDFYLPAAKLDVLAALEIFRVKAGPDSLEVGETLYRLGQIELLQGHPAKAEKYLRESLSIYERARSKADPAALDYVRTELAISLVDQGKFGEAQRFTDALIESSKTSDAPRLEYCLERLAERYDNPTLRAFDEGSRPDQAVRLYGRVLEMEKLRFGENNPVVFKAYANYAEALAVNEKFEEALPCFEKAWQLFKSKKDKSYSDYRTIEMVYHWYVSILRDLHRDEDVLRLQKEAKEIEREAQVPQKR